jgi:hypothetical protein
MVNVLVILLASVSFAQGPGSRIRTGPGVTAPKPPPQRADARRCDSLRDKAKELCLKEVREKTESERRSGPESTGMGRGSSRGGTPR